MKRTITYAIMILLVTSILFPFTSGDLQTRAIDEVDKWTTTETVYDGSVGNIWPICVEYDDKLYISFNTREGNINTGNDNDIVIRAYDGHSFYPSEELSYANNTGGDYQPSGVVYDDKLYISWLTGDPLISNGTDGDIVIRSYDGTTWGDTTEITYANNSMSDNRCRLTVFDDKLYAIWYTNDTFASNGNDFDIIGRSFDGNTWSDIFEISSSTDTGDDRFPFPYVSNNHLYIVWQSEDTSFTTGNDVDILMRSYDGVSWSSIEEVSPTTDTGDDENPQITEFNDELFVVWETNDTSSSDGNDLDIVVRSKSGVSWNPVQELTEAGDSLKDIEPQIITYAEKVIVCWNSENNTDDWDIVLREFDGTGWSEIVEISDPSSNFQYLSQSMNYYKDTLFFTWSYVFADIEIRGYDGQILGFGGLDESFDLESDGDIKLTWNSTTDFSSSIFFNIYISTNPDSFDFSTPNYTTQNLNYTISGLQNGVEYFFVVRAEDSRGNEDNNTIVKSAIPTTSVDSTPPEFDGLEHAINLDSGGQIFLNWSTATDPDSPESNSDPSLPVTYNIYMSTTSGGQNFSNPINSTQNLNFTVTGLTNDTKYFFVVRAEDSVGNEDNNTIEQNVTPTGPPIDTDGDGIPDASDPDDDNDGVPDTSDLFPLDSSETSDFDNDGIGDNADPDDDNDGEPDTTDAFPLDASETSDLDGDGIGDNADPDDDNDGVLDIDEGKSGSPIIWIVLIVVIVAILAAAFFVLQKREK